MNVLAFEIVERPKAVLESGRSFISAVDEVLY